jgi:DNA-binding MarR family transcriptional regulator
VTFAPNPHHRRAPLVVLTDKGRDTFDAATRLQAPQANDLADGLSIADIRTADRVIAALRGKLQGDSTSTG